ncbi:MULTISPECIES: sigma-70 family RNA polymerase sigma factor [unclassified Mucilaginibacter]|uniref:RNA polymerase sigma factor n=1 Tax=unclassified Mucilaginibacter TaxID=2617802 RepID=UPI002AC9682A|nr:MULTISPECIES: sigma-70 family RNA polymerase sigma factor [unclassified Mucilaginibacter]MEB0261309.1 sigma-70 family RNA polymerase sigma factor [Mucilaginibacter sp. 10I4]MEB0280428.1 sigma-70 family RNA polymerase sigma factor [Mucilaginibacter sp. 10B2]MEB0300462.1 sigma-70 family RNA polymerase sigma factor [Mucilaginibacter sp. 5C4]WPX23103.1 sigma-70 family RNA polymerase sigma factor [Mucilaginibacter sp. 5C4]
MENKAARFIQLIEEHKALLFKICRIYQDDSTDRDDLMQEMILQLWLAFDSFEGKSKFSTWMYRVALNTAILFFKKQKRRPDTEQLPEKLDHLEAEGTDTLKDEQLTLFYKAVQQLNKVEKALIFLYMEDEPYEDIAVNLGISEVNVRVRLNRTKNKLKDIVKSMNYEYR